MRPESVSSKKILYACLDWGSGHLARSIPLILQLEKQSNELFFMGSFEQHRVLLQYGFSGRFVELPATGFRFKGDGNFAREGLRNFFRFRKTIQTDHQLVSAFAKMQQIDLIVSDHRYGVYSNEIPSVFVTHQTKLPPGTNFVASWMHERWMKRFSEIWIMDEETDRLAGELSRPLPNGSYIGHYSRFKGQISDVIPGSVAAIISGPEPYAEQLFNEVVERANQSSESWTIIGSGNYEAARKLKSDVRIISDWKEADEAILRAETIVSRNGYTTLMDLKVLGKKAILIPTPGQPEQGYLAQVHDLHEVLPLSPPPKGGTKPA